MGLGKGYNNIVRGILSESLSEDHVTVIEKLPIPRYDEDIAEELKVKATIIRTLLNDLHAKSLVEYKRTKNKKTGWYTYKWKRRDDKIKEYIRNYLLKNLAELNKKLDYEKQNVSFNCSCKRVPLDMAMDNSFICPDCNQKYTKYDTAEIIDEITTEISRINSLLKKT